jgi:hypothetical protein
MRTILNFFKQYIYEVNKPAFLCTALLTAVYIYLNYHYNIDDTISSHSSFRVRFVSRYIIFLTAFIIPYLLLWLFNRKNYFADNRFLILVILAPAVFSFKTALGFSFHISNDYEWNYYWHYILYWPLLVIITSSLLLIIWRIYHPDQSFYGLKTRGIDWKPYLLMLLIMVPLIAAASTQADFLEVYPKMKLIGGIYNIEGLGFWHKLLFELSYGSDFITIELFFRGFIVLGFVKWAGKDAILPMAFFYCTIHFGKPLGECISSFFGGIVLGVIVYHTRSILGGLIVHLGIAWLMELGGHIGNTLKP